MDVREGQDGEPPKKKFRELGAMRELRLRVEDDQEARVRLVEADKSEKQKKAEIFGKELAPGVEQKLQPGTRASVFTWQGAIVEVTGAVAREYEAANPAMRDVFHCALVLEQQCKIGEDRGRPAPRVLVTGSAASGKSTLCQTLANYALRRGRSPLFVELDPRGVGQFRQLPSLPGCVGATVLDQACYELDEEPFDAAAEKEQYPLGRSAFFWYGKLDPHEQPKVYEWACTRLGRVCHAKLLRTSTEDERRVSRSGLIANAPPNPPVSLLTELIQAFRISVVLVADNESLHAELLTMRPPHVEVVHIAKSGGVEIVPTQRLRKLRTQRMRDYFYGPYRELYPHSITVARNSLQLYTLEETEELPQGMLPQGMTQSSETLQVSPYTGPVASLVHCVLALIPVAAPADIKYAPICGLVLVMQVKDDAFVLLSPGAPPLESHTALVGDLKQLKFTDL